MILGEVEAFALFGFIFVFSMSSLILLARFLNPIKVTKIKFEVYECGQIPERKARDFRIEGASKYFLYAIVFLMADVAIWILMLSSLAISLQTVFTLVAYIFLLFISIFIIIRRIPR